MVTARVYRDCRQSISEGIGDTIYSNKTLRFQTCRSSIRHYAETMVRAERRVGLDRESPSQVSTEKLGSRLRQSSEIQIPPTFMNTFVYYMHDSAAEFRLQLSGDFSGDPVRDVHQAWRTASSTIGERRFVVDVSSLTDIDGEGRELIDDWHSRGALIVANSSDAKKRTQMLIACPLTLRETVRKPRRCDLLRIGPRWVVVLLALFTPATLSAPIQCSCQFSELRSTRTTALARWMSASDVPSLRSQIPGPVPFIGGRHKRVENRLEK